MENKKILEALKTAKADSKRKFEQKIDLIFVLKDLDLKKPEHQVDFYLPLHFAPKKKTKVCVFAGPELVEEAKKNSDFVIQVTDFPRYKENLRLIKKLAGEYDYFVAQANIMPQLAQIFGKALGVRGKMPNPKAGCVVPPKSALKPLYDKLQKTVRISAKKEPVVHVIVGEEGQSEEEVVDSIKLVYDQLIHHLPGESNNIKAGYIKLTMGKPVKLEL